jgi:iron complex transport system permease protein
VKIYLILLLLVLLTVALLLTGLFIGSFETSFSVIQETILHFNPEDTTQYAIVYLRLPRLIMAFLVGGALAFSGYIIQALVNNPLADPYILGTASGAALGANVVFFGIIPVSLAGIYLPPVFAFIGAFGITFTAIAIAYKKGRIIPSQLLLGGIALSSLLTAITSLLTFLSDSEGKLKTIIFWTLGSFERSQWSDVPLLAGVTFVFACLFTLLHKQLAILLLGESRAYHLGLNVSRLRWLILTSMALTTAVAVATVGTIGFVGLVIPHMVRGIFGSSNRFNTLFSTWIGGIFMLSCDLMARIAYPPAGLPIGIITSFMGVPFFLYLLLKKDYRFE